MSRPIERLWLSFAVVAVLSSCRFPNDASNTLQVVMDSLPVVPLGDSAQLTARLRRNDGTDQFTGAISYSSDAPAIASVDPDGRLHAIGRGDARITARSVEYADAVAATQTIRVRDGNLDIDSVRPLSVRSGEVLRIYGAGLDTMNVVQVVFGGDGAPILRFDGTAGRDGVLSVVAPLGQPGHDSVKVFTAAGTRTARDAPIAQQIDVHEPNDSVAADIGALDDAIRLGWMVYEAASDTVRDWYTLTSPRQQGIEVVIQSPLDQVLTQIEVRDSAGYAGTAGWLVNNAFQSCGLYTLAPIDRRAIDADVSARVSLGNLPAGRYYIRTQSPPRVVPVGYTFAVDTSLIAVVKRDSFEPDDNCDFVAPRPLPIIADRHTFDHPTDVDWVRFDVATTAQLYAHISPDTLPVVLTLYQLGVGKPAQILAAADSVRLTVVPGSYALAMTSRRSLSYRLDARTFALPAVPISVPRSRR